MARAVMIRFIRDLRLIPIALIASACLLVLKIADITLDGSRLFASADVPASDDAASIIRTSPDAPQPPGQKQSWAQQMFNFPTGSGSSGSTDLGPSADERQAMAQASTQAADADITGSIAKKPAADGKAKPAAPAAKDGKTAAAADGIVIPTDGTVLPSSAEREILQRLEQRREQLDKRSRELDIRENLVKAAEQRIDAHLAEIKEVEAQIKSETLQKDQAEAAHFKGLVTMYENMKPRDAAKIFNGLDMDVLIKVAGAIKPQSMADIMAQMTPEIAERLTVALANKAQPAAKNDASELPKIQGQAMTP
jgi:flagellar motility protein MotE (MotC chaperone)